MTTRSLLTSALLVMLTACGAAQRANEGTIVDREFEPPASGTGVGTGVCTGSNNAIGSCTGTVIWSRGEAWYLIIEAPDGDVWAERVEPEVWARYEEGDHWERPADD